jgi:uncharacterized protein (TIGR02646 family)
MLDFTLTGHTYQLTQAEVTLLTDHPPASRDDWNKGRYYDYKQNVKANLVLRQFDRCAYCRKRLEADGKYEPLDHIVPQTIQGTWIFKVRNLILTCDSCNNLKKKEQTLAVGYENSADLPAISAGYKIFNPHYDNWSEHLNYEDDIFIVAVPNSKGKETIRICQLYRYNVILNRAKELQIGQKVPAKRAMHRLTTLDTNEPIYTLIRNEFLQAVDHFLNRMADMPEFQ